MNFIEIWPNKILYVYFDTEYCVFQLSGKADVIEFIEAEHQKLCQGLNSSTYLHTPIDIASR